MIVVDTSAIIAIALQQPRARDCQAILAADDQLLMSAGTLTELLIVASARGVAAEVSELLAGLGLEIVDVTAGSAEAAAESYARWGRGFHAAHLNFGDCFAYALAKERDCPLLYVGEDFAKTDVSSAL